MRTTVAHQENRFYSNSIDILILFSLDSFLRGGSLAPEASASAHRVRRNGCHVLNLRLAPCEFDDERNPTDMNFVLAGLDLWNAAIDVVDAVLAIF
jgi:hypothetical protein